MAYKNSFCKTGKSKGGLRMNRGPLKSHCFKKNYTPMGFTKELEQKAEAGELNKNFTKAVMDNKGMPMNDRSGMLNYGTSMRKVHENSMAKKYTADDEISKAGLDTIGEPRGRASEFTRGRTSRKYKKAEDLELETAKAANEGNERRARRLARRAARKRRRADRSRSAQDVMATEMFAKGYSEDNSAFDDPKSKHYIKPSGMNKRSRGKKRRK